MVLKEITNNAGNPMDGITASEKTGVDGSSIVGSVNIYETFVRDMEVNSVLENHQKAIRENDYAYVRTSFLRKGSTGTVLELQCPGSKAITVFGKNQVRIFDQTPFIGISIKEPYVFTVRCFDSNDKELDRSTRMNIRKLSTQGGVVRGWRASYGDFSPVNPSKYQFPQGVFLSSGETLVIEALEPDVDIERVEFVMEADIFQASEGASAS